MLLFLIYFPSQFIKMSQLTEGVRAAQVPKKDIQ